MRRQLDAFNARYRRLHDALGRRCRGVRLAGDAAGELRGPKSARATSSAFGSPTRLPAWSAVRPSAGSWWTGRLSPATFCGKKKGRGTLHLIGIDEVDGDRIHRAWFKQGTPVLDQPRLAARRGGLPPSRCPRRRSGHVRGREPAKGGALLKPRDVGLDVRGRHMVERCLAPTMDRQPDDHVGEREACAADVGLGFG